MIVERCPRHIVINQEFVPLQYQMDQTAVEDFQAFHNKRLDSRSLRHSSRPCSLQSQDEPIQSIEQDYEFSDDPLASLSGSARHSSSHDDDENVFDAPPSRLSSPGTSHDSCDDGNVSELYPASRDGSCAPQGQPSSPYTPMKTQSPFRNTSSVREMILDRTPPQYLPSASQQRQLYSTPSRNGTPKSIRSQRSAMMSPSKLSPSKKVKKEFPLVLLHVTLLPIPQLCSIEVMEAVLPSYVLENWKLLREKATETVLERGILIPHPKEDYDLLEERLLESLDLKLPRILKCGHFHLDEAEAADAEGLDDDESVDEDNDADVCEDCGRRIRDGRYGSGTGSRRWDIKLYAANGLMRAGAWSAAWREMERVDVEIIPWMDEEMKRDLAQRTEEEAKHAALLREEAMRNGDDIAGMDEERIREIYGDEAPRFVDDMDDNRQADIRPQTSQQRRPRSQHEVPLLDLLRNFLLTAAQDRRNIAIFLLSIFVIYLSLIPKSTSTAPIIPYEPVAASSQPPIAATFPSNNLDTSSSSSTVNIPESHTTSTTEQEASESVPTPDSSMSFVEETMDFLEGAL